MRCENARLRRKSGAAAGLLYPLLQTEQGWRSLDLRPDRAHPPTRFEMTDTVDTYFERREVDLRQHVGEVLCHVPIHFAHKTQREVQLLVRLPARIVERFHRIDQSIHHGFGRRNRDEQAMAHRMPVTP